MTATWTMRLPRYVQLSTEGVAIARRDFLERVKDVDGFGESYGVDRSKRVPVEVHHHVEHSASPHSSSFYEAFSRSARAAVSRRSSNPTKVNSSSTCS